MKRTYVYVPLAASIAFAVFYGRWTSTRASVPEIRDAAEPVEIRIRNASSLDFEHVKVGSVSYGSIEAGKVSPYRNCSVAYQYATASFVAGGKFMETGPACFSGEHPLRKGRYTCILALTEAGTVTKMEADAKQANQPAQTTPGS